MNLQNMLIHLDGIGFQVLSFLLSTFWQSTILLTGAGILAWKLRNRGDAVRHAIWTAAILALPLLPLLSAKTTMFGSFRTGIEVLPAYETHPAPSAAISSGDGTPSVSRTERYAGTVSDSPDQTTATTTPAPGSDFRDYPWMLALAGYFLVAAALLLWMCIARLRIRRWILDGDPVIDARVLDAFQSAAAQHGLSREYPVFEHPGVPAPLTCRILRPVIILPEGFASDLTGEELRSVALHEMAHIRRRDTLVLALVSLIRTVFFFQPLVWFAARRISFLAELACDRQALNGGANPTIYAELLTRIAFRLPERSPSTELAAGILFTNSAFFRRIRVIVMDRSAQIRRLTPLSIIGLVMIGLFSLLIISALPLTAKSSDPWAGLLGVSALLNGPADSEVTSFPSYTVPFSGENRVVVDGNLAEWQSIGAEPAHLVRGSKDSLSRSRRLSPPSEQNLSAVLQCAVDSDFLFLGVAVRDDKPEFSHHTFDRLWDSDCLEVLLYGDQRKSRAGQILVTLDSDGSLLVGGSDPITNRKYPHLWESLGVRAALKPNSAGYTIELAIPLSVLEWSGWTGNRIRGINVRVYDRDPRQKELYLVEWSDQVGTGWRKLLFPPVPPSGHALYRSKDHEVIRTVLTDIADRKTDAAIAVLRTAGNTPWVRSMLLTLSGEKSEAAPLSENKVRETPSPTIRKWIAHPGPSLMEGLVLRMSRILFNTQGKGTEQMLAEKVQQAPTPEKKAVIEKLSGVWKNYRYNDLSVLMCADMIIKTDRNVPEIERVAEYSLEYGSNTLIYIEIAKNAAKSKRASQEFVDLASVVDRQGGTLGLIKLAKAISQAKTEKELQPLREVIAKLK